MECCTVLTRRMMEEQGGDFDELAQIWLTELPGTTVAQITFPEQLLKDRPMSVVEAWDSETVVLASESAGTLLQVRDLTTWITGYGDFIECLIEKSQHVLDWMLECPDLVITESV